MCKGSCSWSKVDCWQQRRYNSMVTTLSSFLPPLLFLNFFVYSLFFSCFSSSLLFPKPPSPRLLLEYALRWHCLFVLAIKRDSTSTENIIWATKNSKRFRRNHLSMHTKISSRNFFSFMPLNQCCFIYSSIKAQHCTSCQRTVATGIWSSKPLNNFVSFLIWVHVWMKVTHHLECSYKNPPIL